jgi:hypothetical protein
MTAKKKPKALAVTMAALAITQLSYAHNEQDLQNVVRVAHSALLHTDKQPIQGHSVEQIVRAVLELPADTKNRAEAVHNAWMDLLAAEGWAFGETLDQDAKTTPDFVPFAALHERQREYLEIIAAVTADAIHAVNVACSNITDAIDGAGPVLVTTSEDRLPASPAEAQDLVECTDAQQAVPVTSGVACFKDQDRRTMLVARHPALGLVKVPASLYAPK